MPSGRTFRTSSRSGGSPEEARELSARRARPGGGGAPRPPSRSGGRSSRKRELRGLGTHDRSSDGARVVVSGSRGPLVRPSPGAGSPEPSAQSTAATAETVLGWLLGRARALPPGEPLRVELSELRGSVDPDGKAVREAGARLGRAGALLSGARSAGVFGLGDRPGEDSRRDGRGAALTPLGGFSRSTTLLGLERRVRRSGRRAPVGVSLFPAMAPAGSL